MATKQPIAKKVTPKKPTNNLYNLMTQLVQEQKSLWRIQTDYIKDAGGDKELKMFWSEVAQEKEMLIADLQAIIHAELS